MTPFWYELVGPRALEMRADAEGDAPLPPGYIAAVTDVTVISPGTELAAWTGRPPLRPSVPYPRLVGYCHMSTVTSVSSDVSSINVGDQVLTNQPHRSHIRVPADAVLAVVPQTEGDRIGFAATYLYHIGYSGLLAAGFTPGHVVAVIGAGAIGCALAQLLAAFGTRAVVVSRRAASSVIGLPRASVLVAPDAAESTLHEATADIVVNTSDRWKDHRLAQVMAARGGSVVLLGFPGRGEPPPSFNPLDSQYMYDKQLTVLSSGKSVSPCSQAARFSTRRNMEYLVGLIQQGLLSPASLLGTQHPGTALASAYDELSTPARPRCTASLRWR